MFHTGSDKRSFGVRIIGKLEANNFLVVDESLTTDESVGEEGAI